MELFVLTGLVAGIGAGIAWAIGVGAFLLYIPLALVGLLVWCWIVTVIAKRQDDYVLTASGEVVADLVRNSFSKTGWKSVGGRGTLNFQAKGVGFNSRGAKRPVISIDIEDRGDGMTAVQVWTSEWNTQHGVMACCDRVVSQKFRLGRKFRALSSSYAGASPGSPPAAMGGAQGPRAFVGGRPAPTQGGQRKPAADDADVTLPDPGLPEDDLTQLGYQLFKACGLTVLSWGNVPLEQHTQMFLQHLPVFRGTVVAPIGAGQLNGQNDRLWMGFEAPFGSVIAFFAVNTGDDDTFADFVLHNIMNPIGELPGSLKWGIGTVGASVPAGVAQIVTNGQAVPLWRLSPFAGQKPADELAVPSQLGADLLNSGWERVGDGGFKTDVAVAAGQTLAVFFSPYNAESFALMTPIDKDEYVPAEVRTRSYGRYALDVVGDMAVMCQRLPANGPHLSAQVLGGDAHALARYTHQQFAGPQPTPSAAAPVPAHFSQKPKQVQSAWGPDTSAPVTYPASVGGSNLVPLPDLGYQHPMSAQCGVLNMISHCIAYGPGNLDSLFEAVRSLAPIYDQSTVEHMAGYEGEDEWIVRLPGSNAAWTAIGGPAGSAIYAAFPARVELAEQMVRDVDMHLEHGLRAPWTHVDVKPGELFPADFVHILANATVREPWSLRGLGHLSPDTTMPSPQAPAEPYPSQWAPNFAPAEPYPSQWTPNIAPADEYTSPIAPISPAPLATPMAYSVPTEAISPPPLEMPDGPRAPTSRGGLGPRHLALLAGGLAIILAFVLLVSTITRGGDDTASSPITGGGGTNSGPVSADGVSPCSVPPTLQADSASLEPAGLTVTASLTANCSGGDLLSNNRFRVTVVDGASRDVASGIFDLSSTPIAVGDRGATATFTFPAGTYWRTPETAADGLDLAAYNDGSDSAVASTTSTRSTLRATGPGAPEFGSIEAAAQSALVDIAASDRAFIDANLLDVWQPQLSSKYPGLFADGITWTVPDILREHMELRQRFSGARLVWSPEWPVYNNHPQWWITLSGVPFPAGEAANGWCARQGFDADHCFAKKLSHTLGTSETTLFR